jgi:hypothetical protein
VYVTCPAHLILCIPRKDTILLLFISRRKNSVSLISNVTLTVVASNSTFVQPQRISLRSHRRRLESSQAKKCKTISHPLRESVSGLSKVARSTQRGIWLTVAMKTDVSPWGAASPGSDVSKPPRLAQISGTKQ